MPSLKIFGHRRHDDPPGEFWAHSRIKNTLRPADFVSYSHRRTGDRKIGSFRILTEYVHSRKIDIIERRTGEGRRGSSTDRREASRRKS